MSTTSQARRALELFEAAMDLRAEDRDAWVATHAGDDAALAREVRALLSAAERQSGVLETPPDLSALPTLRDALGEALAEGYEIGREIGRGGMATVYLARERKHDRDVVIKVLDPSIAHLFGADRFLREVRIAATLAHPHIVPLIDSGDADGFLYYVMPWMDGETLRDRLRRGRPTLAEAHGVMRDMAGALAFAHEAGVVHRDLKPENVLLTAGHAYLLDFGIAKLIDESPSATNITMPGFPLGTQRYMAPEQAMAADAVDGRADIFAWGLLGVELLVAESLPAGAGSVRAALARRDDLPAPLVSLLLECVATDPDDRPATMSQVVARLDAITPAGSASATTAPAGRRRPPMMWTGMVGVAAVVAVVGLWLSGRWGGASAAGADAADGAAGALAEPLAVTVLHNETGDSSLSVVGRYAGDWITDGLQRMGGVRTVPWSEARLASEHAMRTGAPLVGTVRDEVGAGTIVTGTYYRRRDSLHLQAQLTDARTGRVVSALAPIVVPADRPDDGVAELRDRVLGAVAVARDERVATLPGVRRAPPSFSAYRSFDLGFERYLAQDYREASVSFRDAFERDTTFTAALLFGARAAWNTGDFATAEALVVRARAQDRDLGIYHESALRYIEALLQGDGPEARSAIQRAAALAPNSRAGFDHAAALLNAGQARAAREQLRKMDPDRGEMRGWGSYWTQLAHAENMLGNHEGELRAAREMARRFPDRRVALVLEARALAAAGDLRRLDSALVAWESLPADVYWSQGASLVVAFEELTRRGRPDDARRYADRALDWLTNRLVAAPTDRSHRYHLGSILYGLERFEESRPYFDGLAREFPDRTRYRGLAAVAAARAGDLRAAERWLEGVPPRDQGELLTFQARIAAIRGDTERAITLLTQALDRGVEGFPWIPLTAYRDLEPLTHDPRGRALLAGR